MRQFKSYIVLAFAFGLATAGCTRESGRGGESDVPTNAFVNRGTEEAANQQNGGPAADNTGESIDTSRAPASTEPANPTERKADQETLPKDEKGIVGSPYASNINRSTEGQPQVGKKQGMSPSDPNAQPAPASGGQAGAAAGASASAAGKIGGEPIDVQKFPFAKKEDFKSTMGARLQAVDQAIDAMKEAPTTTPQKTAQLQSLDKKAIQLQGELKAVDSVSSKNWESFKTKFKDQMVSLEKQYNDVLTASR